MTERYYSSDALQAALQSASDSEGSRENVLATEVQVLRSHLRSMCEQAEALLARFAGDPSQERNVVVLPPALYELCVRTERARWVLP